MKSGVGSVCRLVSSQAPLLCPTASTFSFIQQQLGNQGANNKAPHPWRGLDSDIQLFIAHRPNSLQHNTNTSNTCDTG